MNKTASQSPEEAERLARETDKQYRLPQGTTLSIMNALKDTFPSLGEEAREFALRTSPFGDETEIEALNAFPFAPPVIATRTVTGIRVKKDNATEIVRYGHTLARENLELMGSHDLVEAVRNICATVKDLTTMAEEKSRLAGEIENLRQFVATEPALIEHEIKRRFPEGTAGKSVNIVPSPDGTYHRLLANGSPVEIAVAMEFGQAILDRNRILEQARTDLLTKTSRWNDLDRKITDSKQILPILWRKIQHLSGYLDRAELARRFNGEFIGFSLDDQDQPVVLVKREVNEVLTEIPEAEKRSLIARHLAGEELPENIQKALGIDGAIAAVTCCLNPPKLELPPQPIAGDHQTENPAAKPKGKAKSTS